MTSTDTELLSIDELADELGVPPVVSHFSAEVLSDATWVAAAWPGPPHRGDSGHKTGRSHNRSGALSGEAGIDGRLVVHMLGIHEGVALDNACGVAEKIAIVAESILAVEVLHLDRRCDQAPAE
jgi:hypothetical protein